MEKTVSKRNQYAFSLGTIGRDMLYTLVSMYLMFYLTDILQIPNSTLWWITGVMFVNRFWDAVNDPIMGVLVDNTKSRFGKFKPWIASGAVLSGVFTILFFKDFGLTGTSFVIVFALIYLLWEISFTANDIAYWSMMPSLSIDQKEREKIGAMARNCANIGMFSVVVGIVPITKALGNALGSMQKGYFAFAVIIVIIMIAGQLFTLIGVKEPRSMFKTQDQTTLRDMVKAIFKNDQLLFTAISMGLFMIGYTTTTSFGLYFFKYAYGDEGMYAIFAAVLGVSQISALLVFPLFSKRFTRKTLYSAAIALVVAGYVLFFFSPMNMIFIGISGMLLFIGQAFIQLLMLVFLADTIEYGQWKLGRRNESVTFSLQPFINKIGSAAASGIVGATVIISGINDAATAKDVTSEGLLLMKMAMFVLPLLSILAGYVVYRLKFKIDKPLFDQIVADLKERGDITK
jgi:sugar (glycoside-pentoside-hexuronide) transporter